jgi:hypothetical protein
LAGIVNISVAAMVYGRALSLGGLVRYAP